MGNDDDDDEGLRESQCWRDSSLRSLFQLAAGPDPFRGRQAGFKHRSSDWLPWRKEEQTLEGKVGLSVQWKA